MTKTSLPLFIICMFFAFYCSSCNSKNNGHNPTPTQDSTTAVTVKGKDPRNIGGQKSDMQLAIDQAGLKIKTGKNPLLGYWVGPFGKNMINLTLSEINDTLIKGYSVCAGNYRPITGSVKALKKDKFKIAMTEPGDDKYDGKFEFEVSTATNELTGKWTPFKEKGNETKEYILYKRDFTYNANAGDHPETSTRELTEADVENLSVEELEIMRNEIYARHGYSFKNKKMRYYFEGLDWYVPMGIDIRSQLSDTEVKNIDLIYRYEEYYKVNYDSYGR